MVNRASRFGILVAVAACVGALAGPAAATDSQPLHRVSQISAVNSMEPQVLAQINQIRTSRGLAALRLSASLSAAADQHSLEMAQDGYFAHNSFNGGAFDKRIAHFYGIGKFHYWSVGENLLWRAPDIDAATALQMWMESPDHRANLLDPRWREIGLSAVRATGASGVYAGLDATIITTDFGVRR